MGNGISSNSASGSRAYAANQQFSTMQPAESSKKSQSKSKTQYPDLSNIQNLPQDVAGERSKKALQIFLVDRYNMFTEAQNMNFHNIGEGACVGLSSQWVEHSGNMKTMRYPVTMENAINFQIGYEKARARYGDGVLKNMLYDKGFTKSETAYAGADDIAVLAKKSGNHVIGMAGFGVGHAVAMHTPAKNSADQHVTFFDPQMGSFKFNRADANYFFKAYEARLASVGTRFNTMEVYTKP